MAPALLVLAAGIGSRYGGVKQIDPVGPHGEIVVDYSIYDALRAGFDRVVFVITRSLHRDFDQKFGSALGGRAEVRYVFQDLDAIPKGFAVPPGRAKPWGTGHAVLIAGQALDKPFAVINADDFYGADAYRSMADFLRTARDRAVAEYAMVGYTLRKTLSAYGRVARGVCTPDESGYLKHVVEITGLEKDGRGARYTDKTGVVKTLTGDELVSMNLWGFTPSIFGHLEREFRRFLEKYIENPEAEFYIPSAVDKFIVEGRARVKILPTHSPWFGMTYKEDRAVVQRSIRRLIAAGEYPEKLWA